MAVKPSKNPMERQEQEAVFLRICSKCPFIVELVENGPLGLVLELLHPLHVPLKKPGPAISDLLFGLGFIHEMLISHRNVKIENLLQSPP